MFQQTILIYGFLAAWSLRTDAPSGEEDTVWSAPQEWRRQARLHAENRCGSILLRPTDATQLGTSGTLSTTTRSCTSLTQLTARGTFAVAPRDRSVSRHKGRDTEQPDAAARRWTHVIAPVVVPGSRCCTRRIDGHRVHGRQSPHWPNGQRGRPERRCATDGEGEYSRQLRQRHVQRRRGTGHVRSGRGHQVPAV